MCVSFQALVKVKHVKTTHRTAQNSPSIMMMSNGMKQTVTMMTSPCPIKAPLVVTIIGLPCRGKSFSARKIARNLFWKGEQAKG